MENLLLYLFFIMIYGLTATAITFIIFVYNQAEDERAKKELHEYEQKLEEIFGINLDESRATDYESEDD